jgi:site-specific DNA-cytosine methylase
VTQPADRGIRLKDILQPDAEVDDRFVIKKELNKTTNTGRKETKKIGYIGDGEQYGQGGQAHRVYDTEGKTPTLSSYAPLIKIGHIGETDGQANRVYSVEGKSVTLSANGGGLGAKTGLYEVGKSALTEKGLCYVGSLGGSTRKGMDGQESLSRAHHQCNRVYLAEGKSPCLSASETSGRTNILVGGLGAKTGLYDVGKIRKLTPIECERLQGLPDNYTEGVANTHRYKCLGNAFHVDVVAHILQSLREDL